MLRLNGTDYGLCLLDTNATSAMVKQPEREFRHYMEWSCGVEPFFIPSFSLFTMLELRQSPRAYQGFTDLFGELPCVFLKSFDQLITEEIDAYPDPTSVDPCLVGFAGPLAVPGADLASVLETFFQTDEGQDVERKWNDGRSGVVEGIRSLVPNYRPKGSTYTPREIRTFLEVTGFGQIAMREGKFARQLLDSGKAVEIDAFPSVKAATYTVFHKFYADKTRKDSESDAYDIIISSASFYVDAIITEKHQAEVLRKTKQQDDFINHLRVFTLRDFRRHAPSRRGRDN